MLEKAFYMFALVCVFIVALACRPVHSLESFQDLQVKSSKELISKADEAKDAAQVKKYNEELEDERLATLAKNIIEARKKKFRESNNFLHSYDGKYLKKSRDEDRMQTFNPDSGDWE